ncbi:hypothetical protein FV139_20245 [Parahaliea maris]|uniref:Uncharacterized protein n=1 Tax=Parahaliea maris TaxID=2716870 RepID=A0A5C8ZPG5_9GAMM|nr:hypothetical protein [Parahaliea maris]TXS89271.1 hypothetical protein FV139_20245 [Parahaliea maris]
MLLLLTELERRWKSIFEQLEAGLDVPPGERLRAEGLMEALAILDPGAEARLQAAMDVAYRQVCGRGLDRDLGDDWGEFYPFPQIPAVMQRAPVYPSTSDHDQDSGPAGSPAKEE